MTIQFNHLNKFYFFIGISIGIFFSMFINSCFKDKERIEIDKTYIEKGYVISNKDTAFIVDNEIINVVKCKTNK